MLKGAPPKYRRIVKSETLALLNDGPHTPMSDEALAQYLKIDDLPPDQVAAYLAGLGPKRAMIERLAEVEEKMKLSGDAVGAA